MQRKEIQIIDYNGYPLTILKGWANASEQTRHSHRRTIVGCVLEGKRIIHFNDREYSVADGGSFVIPANEPHFIVSGKPHYFILISIDPNSIKTKYQDDILFLEKEIFESKILSGQIIDLSGVLFSGDEKYKKETELNRWLNKFMPAFTVIKPAVKEDKVDEIFNSVRQYILKNLTEPLTLRDLSNHSGMSPFYLSRSFTKTFHLPPHLFLIQERVRLACKELKNGKAISTVAQESGFYDQAHLSKAFSRFVGVTPEQFKKASLHL